MQAGGADNRDEHDVCRGQGGEFEQAVVAGVNTSRCAEDRLDFARSGGVVDGNGFGAMFERLFGQQFGVVSGRQPDKADAIRQVLGDLDRAGADGPRAAQKNYVLHLRFTIYDLRAARRAGGLG